MPDIDDSILDRALTLAMEFGENWLQPNQNRLRGEYPHLTPAELSACNAVCQAAREHGVLQVPACWREAAGDGSRAFTAWRAVMREHHPWISDGTARRLFSQGRYYAWKDGEI